MSVGLNILFRHSFMDYGLGTMTAPTLKEWTLEYKKIYLMTYSLNEDSH